MVIFFSFQQNSVNLENYQNCAIRILDWMQNFNVLQVSVIEIPYLVEQSKNYLLTLKFILVKSVVFKIVYVCEEGIGINIT